MGKDLKGKELGAGLLQREDGKYVARYSSRNGKRVTRYFLKVNEAKQWLAQAKYDNEHGNIASGSRMTLDTWFDYWINDIKANTVRYSTLKNYSDRYTYNIKELLGKMIISDIKPLHCQSVINNMARKGYSTSSMTQARITMSNMFSCAVENDIIPKNPITKSVKCPKIKKQDTRVLTVEEQKLFLEEAKNTTMYNHFVFVLQTGLRVGELTGLQWGDIDFNKRTISINRSVRYHTIESFRVGEPKSATSYRTIPLTETAYNILTEIKKGRKKTKVVNLAFKDFVFLGTKDHPITNIYYNNVLERCCKKIGIQKISMHTLRHTFATRCIEAGMRPKTLQEILGHCNISVTMDLYVHVTENSKEEEMEKVQNYIEMA